MDDSSVIGLEYEIVRLCFGCRPDVQALCGDDDGRYYDRLSFLVEAEGKVYRIDQWFDITRYYQRTYGRVSGRFDETVFYPSGDTMSLFTLRRSPLINL